MELPNLSQVQDKMCEHDTFRHHHQMRVSMSGLQTHRFLWSLLRSERSIYMASIHQKPLPRIVRNHLICWNSRYCILYMTFQLWFVCKFDDTPIVYWHLRHLSGKTSRAWFGWMQSSRRNPACSSAAQHEIIDETLIKSENPWSYLGILHQKAL